MLHNPIFLKTHQDKIVNLSGQEVTVRGVGLGGWMNVVSDNRKIDPEHIVFLDGDRYYQDFTVFDAPIENAVYTLHDYPTPGFIDGGPYPGISRGEYLHKATYRRSYWQKS